MEQHKKPSFINVVIDGISGIFWPVVNLLIAAGIMKGLLALLTTLEFLSIESDTYLVLNAMADSLFYFLPIFLAFTSAKKFGANPYTAVLIAGMTLHPSLNTILEAGTTVYFLGIPLNGVMYHSTVIPILLATATLRYVERFLNKILPEMVKGFMTPLLSVFIVGFLTLSIFGSVGMVVGDVLAVGYEYIYGLSPLIAGLLLGAAIQPMSIGGLHWPLILIAMNNVIVGGSDTILALMSPPVFAQAGACLAVLLKSKSAALRTTCASAALSSLFGITEPATFGVNLPRKKPMAAVCIGGGIGGAIAGLSGAAATSFAFASIVALPVFLGPGFVLFVGSCAIGFAISFMLTLILKFEVDGDLQKDKDSTKSNTIQGENSQVQFSATPAQE